MKYIIINGKQIELDADGFLLHPDEWNNDVAMELAKLESIPELTEQHWKIVRFIREYFLKFSTAPMIRKLCKESGLNLKQIYELFPTGPAKGACKIAGLPVPTGCI